MYVFQNSGFRPEFLHLHCNYAQCLTDLEIFAQMRLYKETNTEEIQQGNVVINWWYTVKSLKIKICQKHIHFTQNPAM